MSLIRNRREVLQLLSAAAGSAALGPILSACNGTYNGSQAKSLAISNWPLFIDTDQANTAGTVRRFEQSTGIRVIYREDLNDPDSFFSRIRLPLAMGLPVEQDIIMVPNWLASRMIRLGWLEKLPWSQIPNARNLNAVLRKPLWDPNGAYTLPWQVGITGIAYNIKATGRELTSVDDLFNRSLAGRVSFLSLWRDTLGLLMLADGKNITRPTYADAKPALARLQQAKAKGQIRSFTGNDYQKDLLVGNLAACVAWAGDVAQLLSENPDLRFVVPKSGGVLTADVMVIPRKADTPNEAAAWMNFVYEPGNAAKIVAATHFISPVDGVREVFAASASTADLVNDPLMFPPPAMRARLQMLGPFSDRDEQAIERDFSRLIAS
jgi:spermidine/putrescine transport system substrate-binding protein